MASRSSRGSWRRMWPASISASRNSVARAHQRLERGHQAGGRRGARPAHLPDQAQQFGPAGGQAEHRAHHRLHPGPAGAGRGQRLLQGGRQLDGAPVDDRLEQDLLGREPVEDGLLADLEAGGQGVERRGVVAAGGERGQGGVQDPLGGGRPRPTPADPPAGLPTGSAPVAGPGSAALPMLDSVTYHMVDRSGDPRP